MKSFLTREAFFIFALSNLLLIMGLFSKKKDKKEEAPQPARREDTTSRSVGEGLEKTRESVFKKLSRAVAGKATVDDEVLDNLEEVLITSDVGVDTTLRIIERIEKRVARDKYLGTGELNRILREEIAALLSEQKEAEGRNFSLEGLPRPYVIMVVGVNGVGKTTTIAKLAHQYKQHGYSVVLGAADTFRAAAIDQLQVWADRAGVPLVKQQMGSDPASVVFDTLRSAQAHDTDVVIIDTAGRLHNKVNLMNELGKIKRVMQKVIAQAPHEILLVLDGSTGQNAFEQARQFTEVTQVNAIAVTKLDGTAKGGVVIGVSDTFGIPVKYIGIGEGMEDLRPFDREEFVNSLFPSDN
jgi:fused signal recognition particle receptor